jgi:hypothetical protein
MSLVDPQPGTVRLMPVSKHQRDELQRLYNRRALGYSMTPSWAYDLIRDLIETWNRAEHSEIIVEPSE